MFKKWSLKFKDEECEKALYKEELGNIKKESLMGLLFFYLFGALATLGLICHLIKSGENFLDKLIPYYSISLLMTLFFFLSKHIHSIKLNLGNIFVILFYSAVFETNDALDTHFYFIFGYLSYQIIQLLFQVQLTYDFIHGLITIGISVTYCCLRVTLHPHFGNLLTFFLELPKEDRYTYIMVMLQSIAPQVFALYYFKKQKRLAFYFNYQQEKEWRKVIEYIPEGVAVMDEKNIILNNTELNKMLGIPQCQSRDEIKERFTQLFASEEPQSSKDEINPSNASSLWDLINDFFERQDGTTALIEKKHFAHCMRSDGDEEEERKRLLQIQGKEFVNEKQKSLFLVLSDISILQNIEEAKLQAKEMTVATVTHELRTPANSILSMLTLLKKPNLKRSDFLQFLKVAISSTMLLLNLINDIMDFSKFKAGTLRIRFSAISILEIVKEAVEVIELQAKMKQLEILTVFDSHLQRKLVSDGKRIMQILLNLLSNALKFTQKGFIRISVSSFRHGFEEMVRITVEDTGIGIKEKDQAKLFKSFSMLEDSSNLNTQGTGLGLFLCSKLVQMLGGEIEVQSKYGEGSIFAFSIKNHSDEMSPLELEKPDFILKKSNSPSLKTIPVDNSKDELDSIEDWVLEENTERTFKPAQILIVDDNDFNIFSLQLLLNRFDLKAEMAHNGKEALQKLRETHYKIIFMDCLMPIMDGFEASLKIKELEEKKLINPCTVIGLTSNVELIMQDTRHAMHKFIEKPISEQTLANLLAKHNL